MANNKPNKVGRPTKYRKEYCQIAINLGKEGKGRAHLASTIGVSVSSIREWEIEHEEFSTAMEQNYDLCEVFWLNHAINRAPESDKMIMFMLQHKFKYGSVDKEATITNDIDINFNDIKPSVIFPDGN
jgi:DNA-binding XRE family transcriptional regulator